MYTKNDKNIVCVPVACVVCLTVCVWIIVQSIIFSLSLNDQARPGGLNRKGRDRASSVLREWVLEVREVKSEMKIWFTHFEK